MATALAGSPITRRIHHGARALRAWPEGDPGHLQVLGLVSLAGLSGTALADTADLLQPRMGMVLLVVARVAKLSLWLPRTVGMSAVM